MYPKFIHLNVHSEYSIKDGICKIKNLINKCVKYNIPAIALTDYFNLSSWIKFTKIAYLNGIKPLLGVDIYINYKKNYNSFINIESHLATILVMNNIGYKNLLCLISKFLLKNSNISDKYSIYFKFITLYNEGLIFLLSFDKYSCVGKFYIYKDLYFVRKIILFWKKILFDRLYINIYKVNNINEDKYINNIINLSYELNISVVATNKVLFIYKKDFKINKIRSAIYYNCKLNDIKNYINYTKYQYLKTEKEMLENFSDIPEVLYNSVQIAERCNFILKKKKSILPNYSKFSNENLSKYIKYLCFKSLRKSNIINKTKNKLLKYKSRLNYELYVISKMSLSNYFLIVMEFIKWAKRNKIPVGPGRGSGAGSLVAYLLQITEIDPIKFNLIFERFINLERISIPDFDIDFCMEKRDKVLLHIEKLYNKKSVAQIVTFNTLTAKSVIRDVGRVLGYSYNLVDYIAKLIPFNIGINIKTALNKVPKLLKLYNKNIDIKKLINISKNLEGIIKGIGKHAGGIVISPTKIYDFCSIYFDKQNKKLITQFDKIDIEYLGLVKFDLLGLRTLTVINKTLNLIKLNKNIVLDINKISLNNKLSFNLLKKADTTSVFQLESKGIRELIKKLQPDCFEDIVALLALFRPGPLQSGMVENFINRKHGKEKVYYPIKGAQHKLLIPILKCTYGIILYQEQVMEISRVIGDYNLGLADILRRCISDNNKNDIKKHKKIFKKGSKRLGIDTKLALKIFSLMVKCSGYGFNRSHSVSYAMIAYQTLWLKTNYFSEFMVSVMNSDIDNINKIVNIIKEIKVKKIKIIYPNINISDYYFKLDINGNIIYGLGAIKGIGKSTIKHIIDIRIKYKKYNNFIHFCILNINNKLSNLTLESLIYSGCFDIFNINRFYLRKNIKLWFKIIIFNNKQYYNFKQNSLFKNNNYKEYFKIYKKKYLNNIYKNELILIKEKEFLGMYLTDHPINKYYKFIKKYFLIIKINNLLKYNNNKKLYICVIINDIKIIKTKNNYKLCILNVEDNTSDIEVLLFENKYNNYIKFLKIYNIIIIYGYNNYKVIQYKNSLLAENIILFDKKKYKFKYNNKK